MTARDILSKLFFIVILLVAGWFLLRTYAKAPPVKDEVIHDGDPQMFPIEEYSQE